MHFSVLAILDKDLGPNPSLQDLADAIAELMDPYNENEHQTERVVETYDGEEEAYWRNPEGRWDWFLIGGRWANRLRVGAGATAFRVMPDAADRLARSPEESLCYSTLLGPVGEEGGPADIARKEDVDLEAMGMAKVEWATKAWHEAQERFAKDDRGDLDFFTEMRRGESLEDAIKRCVRPPTWYVFLDQAGWDSQGEHSYSRTMELDEYVKLSKEEHRARMAQEQLEWEAHCIERWREIPDGAWLAVLDYHS